MRPRPKFADGEEVYVVCDSGPDMPRAEITKVEWVDSWCPNNDTSLVGYEGYRYRLNDHGSLRSPEYNLRKLPPEDRLSWEDVKYLINQPEVEPC